MIIVSLRSKVNKSNTWCISVTQFIVLWLTKSSDLIMFLATITDQSLSNKCGQLNRLHFIKKDVQQNNTWVISMFNGLQSFSRQIPLSLLRTQINYIKCFLFIIFRFFQAR